MISKFWVSVLAALFPATPLYATSYVFTLTATVSDLYTVVSTYDDDGLYDYLVPTQSNSVKIGSKLALSFNYNAATAVLQPIGFYVVTANDFTIRLGDYQSSLQPPGLIRIDLNNYADDPFGIDSFAIVLVQALKPNTSPFVLLGAQPVYAAVNFGGADATEKAPENEINNEVPLSAYPDQDMYLDFFTQGGLVSADTSVILSDPVATLSPLSAVPEPSTWVMTILGIGAIGFAMRRRSVARLVANAI